jgi:hypothetical protein
MLRKPAFKKRIMAGLALILLVPPSVLVFRQCSRSGGVVGLICFGELFQGSLLPEIKALAPPPVSPHGYDAQFYAPMAVHPGLLDCSGLPVAESYRARRIGLPALAFCLGAGRPVWILHVYALLNAGFWLILWAALMRYTGFRRPRDLLLAGVLLWSTGTLSSLTRALTDFPATVLGTLAILFFQAKPVLSAVLLSASGLVKETSVLSFAAIPWDGRFNIRSLKKLLFPGLMLCLPLTLWLTFVQFRIGDGLAAGTGNFSFPFFGVAQKVYTSLQELIAQGFDLSGLRLFELLCPLSLLVQMVYLILKPRLSSCIWRFGAGFAGLFMFLGASVWAEQYAYARVLLPLTFSFNLLIHQNESGRRLGLWYLLGNGGLCWLLFAACWFMLATFV